jgi:hypothetical protein
MTVVITSPSQWVKVPENDEQRSYWLNLGSARRITFHPNPIRLSVFYSSSEQLVLTGIQAIAVYDFLKTICEELPDE